MVTLARDGDIEGCYSLRFRAKDERPTLASPKAGEAKVRHPAIALRLGRLIARDARPTILFESGCHPAGAEIFVQVHPGLPAWATPFRPVRGCGSCISAEKRAIGIARDRAWGSFIAALFRMTRLRVACVQDDKA